MPRTDNDAFKSHLAETITTTAHCLKITLTDERVIAVPQHDMAITIGGVVCEADGGYTPSTVNVTMGLSTDNGEATSAIDIGVFTESELVGGVLNNAEVEVTLVNWADPTEYYVIMSGVLGQVERTSSSFKIELRSKKDQLRRNTGRVYTQMCDAMLGDTRCAKDVSTSQFRATGVAVSAVTDNLVVVVDSALSAFVDRWFANGLLTFTSGAVDGQSFAIRSDSKMGGQHILELWQPPLTVIEVGDTFTVTAGCDKTLSDCRLKFANTINFRGFPYIPTSSRINSYIVRNLEDLDGGSIYY